MEVLLNNHFCMQTLKILFVKVSILKKYYFNLKIIAYLLKLTKNNLDSRIYTTIILAYLIFILFPSVSYYFFTLGIPRYY